MPRRPGTRRGSRCRRRRPVRRVVERRKEVAAHRVETLPRRRARLDVDPLAEADIGGRPAAARRCRKESAACRPGRRRRDCRSAAAARGRSRASRRCTSGPPCRCAGSCRDQSPPRRSVDVVAAEVSSILRPSMVSLIETLASSSPLRSRRRAPRIRPPPPAPCPDPRPPRRGSRGSPRHPAR